MSRPFVDLRSDTATRPTPEMREAIAHAEVGDDTLGEDPTVNALLEKSTKIFGKEDALYLPSGTQANQIAIKTYTQPGDEIVADARCHPFRSELGAGPFLSGVQFALITTERGVYAGADADAWIRPEGSWPQTAVLWVENTHNFGGGEIFPIAKLDELRALSIERNIPLHIDGARIFNAIVASGTSPREWGERCDSLCFCLSKGLGCPVGSILMGTAEFIAKATRFRKMFGGGWRQAGLLAAAGIYALDHHVERLALDHENAQLFAELTAGVPGVRHVYETTPTNIVFLDVSESGRSAQEVNERAMESGVAFSIPGKDTLRAVTHLDVTREDIEKAAMALRKAVR